MEEQEREPYEESERRRETVLVLTEFQIDEIAERAAQKVLDNLHIQVGKAVVRAGIYGLGALLLVGAVWTGLLEKVMR